MVELHLNSLPLLSYGRRRHRARGPTGVLAPLDRSASFDYEVRASVPSVRRPLRVLCLLSIYVHLVHRDEVIRAASSTRGTRPSCFSCSWSVELKQVSRSAMHDHSRKYQKHECVTKNTCCSIFSASGTIISHERQRAVLWWFEAESDVQDGVGDHKQAYQGHWPSK